MTDVSRKGFEEWMLEQKPPRWVQRFTPEYEKVSPEKYGQYVDMYTELAWQSWKEARNRCAVVFEEGKQ